MGDVWRQRQGGGWEKGKAEGGGARVDASLLLLLALALEKGKAERGGTRVEASLLRLLALALGKGQAARGERASRPVCCSRGRGRGGQAQPRWGGGRGRGYCCGRLWARGRK